MEKRFIRLDQLGRFIREHDTVEPVIVKCRCGDTEAFITRHAGRKMVVVVCDTCHAKTHPLARLY